MEFDLQELAQWLAEEGLMSKPFYDFTQEEIEALCEQVHKSTVFTIYSPSFIDELGVLNIPENAPPKERYWEGGMKVIGLLEKLGASDEVKRRYRPQYENGFTSDSIIGFGKQES